MESTKNMAGRQAYSEHEADTIEDTISEMESRWYDEGHTMTEADKMVEDYNRGESPLLCEELSEPQISL